MIFRNDDVSGLAADDLIKEYPQISVVTLPSQTFFRKELKKLYDEGIKNG